MRIIGLTGKAGAGKDEAAKALVELGYRRDAFADRMRKAILALDPIVTADVRLSDVDAELEIVVIRLAELVGEIGWDSAKRDYPEVRRLLQKFGTEAGRDIYGKDHWVGLLVKDYLDADEPKTVVTDVRFNNEAEVIRSLGGAVISIERPGLEALPGNHASEAGIDTTLVDFIVINGGTIADLHERVAHIVQTLTFEREEIYP